MPVPALRHAWTAAGTAASHLRPRGLAPRQIRGPMSQGAGLSQKVTLGLAAMQPAEYALPAGDEFAAAGQHGTANSGASFPQQSVCARPNRYVLHTASTEGRWAAQRIHLDLGGAGHDAAVGVAGTGGRALTCPMPAPGTPVMTYSARAGHAWKRVIHNGHEAAQVGRCGSETEVKLMELKNKTALPREEAAARLRAIADELAFEERLAAALASRADTVVRRREVADEQEAAAVGMHGSPTLLVDGVDPFAAPGQPPSLSCRLYRDAAGRAAPAPSVGALRQVLAAPGDA